MDISGERNPGGREERPRTIRQKLDAIRSRVVLLALAGWLVFLAGIAAGAGEQEKLALAIAGFVVFCVAVFQLTVGLRCPRCEGSIGYAVSWPPGKWLSISRRVTHCPLCGVDLDSQLQE